MDDELTRDGDAVRRARCAHDSAAFSAPLISMLTTEAPGEKERNLPTVVFPEQEAELSAAHWTPRDVGVRLPDG
jgi:hypothetical protein